MINSKKLAKNAITPINSENQGLSKSTAHLTPSRKKSKRDRLRIFLGDRSGPGKPSHRLMPAEAPTVRHPDPSTLSALTLTVPVARRLSAPPPVRHTSAADNVGEKPEAIKRAKRALRNSARADPMFFLLCYHMFALFNSLQCQIIACAAAACVSERTKLFRNRPMFDSRLEPADAA